MYFLYDLQEFKAHYSVTRRGNLALEDEIAVCTPQKSDTDKFLLTVPVVIVY